MTTTLSVYPLSADAKSRLAAHFGEPIQYLSAIELRRLSLMDMLRKLRSLPSGTLVVSAEDVQGAILLPFLELLALITPANSIQVSPDGATYSSVSRAGILLSSVRLAFGSARGAISALETGIRAHALACRQLLPVEPRPFDRVLYLNPNLWFGLKAGGSLGHVAGVANMLVRKGFSIDYVAADNALLLAPAIEQKIVRPQWSFGWPFDANRFRYHDDLVTYISKLMEEREYSFIYQRLAIGGMPGVEVSRRCGIPLVLEYNSSEVWVASNWGLAPKFRKAALAAEDACLKHAHLVVTVSENLQQELLERGVPEERIVFYPNCIDPEAFDPAKFTAEHGCLLRARYGIAPEALVVTFVGTFGQWHGVDVLARAIRKLADESAAWLESRKIRFLLVGDGQNMPLVRDLLGGDRYRRIAVLAGMVPQSEAPAHLAASDILLSPHVDNADGTRFFGSPTKLFEYMAMGKPIVASDVGQIGQVIDPSLRGHALPSAEPGNEQPETGILCRSNDIDELLQSIRFLVERPFWRMLLGTNAQKKALATYTWDKHVGAILGRMTARKLLARKER